MSASVIIFGAVFLCVVALIFFVAMAMRDKSLSEIEGRLSTITKGKVDLSSLSDISSQVAKDMDAKTVLEQFANKWLNLSLMFEQAKVSMTVPSFLLICLGLGLGATLMCGIAGAAFAACTSRRFCFCFPAILLVVVSA